MASKFLRNRINPCKNQEKTSDVLALEKAAAWAWYQHGSGSEGKSMREFHVTRTQCDHRPSRYKLEAMRTASSSSSSSSHEETNYREEGSVPSSSSVQKTKKLLPLLDAYEVRSILTRLDSLIAESDDEKADHENGRERMKKKKVGRKGMWERRRVRVMCSTRKEDVVDATTRDPNRNQIHRSSLPAAKCSAPTAAKRSLPRVVNVNGGRVM